MMVAVSLVAAPLCETCKAKDNFTIVRDRIVSSVMPDDGKKGSKSLDNQVNKIWKTLGEDGAFAGIDYQNHHRTKWTPIKHWDSLMTLSQAYVTRGSQYYHDQKLAQSIKQALRYWLKVKPYSKNWWGNKIAMPKRLGCLLLMLENENNILEPELRKHLIKYWEDNSLALSSQTGANKVDVAIHYLYRACFTKNKALMKEAVDALLEPLAYTMKEGIQHDLSYHQHGPQLYIGGYGSVMLHGIMETSKFLEGTEFALSGEKLEILSRFVRETYLPSIRGDHMSWTVLGRGVTRERATLQRGLDRMARRLMVMDPEHKREYQETIDRAVGKKGPGYGVAPRSRVYYRSDYVRHQREGFFYDIRMVSNRTDRNESGNGEGLKVYFLSDGGSALMMTGREYVEIFPVWDWAAVPGTTCPQVDSIPHDSDWGKIGKNSFVGGASDGRYSVVAYQYRDHDFGINSSARKSWFLFDREIVCLGSDLQSTNGAPLATTINQCLWDGKAIVREQGRSQEVNTLGYEAKGKQACWILHGGAGYYIPQGNRATVRIRQQQGRWKDINANHSDRLIEKDVFLLQLDHGVRPVEASYSYIIVPGLTQEKELEAYLSETRNSGVEILQNSKDLQAVYHEGLDILQVVFWEPGSFDFRGGTFQVDQPCILMMKRSPAEGITFYITDPTGKLENVSLTLSSKGAKDRKIVFPTGKDQPWEKGRTHGYRMKSKQFFTLN